MISAEFGRVIFDGRVFDSICSSSQYNKIWKLSGRRDLGGMNGMDLAIGFWAVLYGYSEDGLHHGDLNKLISKKGLACKTISIGQ